MKCPVIKSAWLIFVLPLLCQWLNAAQLGVLTYEVTTDGIVITDCNEAATEVEIPQIIGMFEVTSIGERVFWKHPNLISITIPGSLRVVREGSFFTCENLRSVKILDGIEWIDRAAFASCWNLVSVTLPESLISIGEHAFSGCSNLESLAIPWSVTYVGPGAFRGCGLTSISIPASMVSVGPSAFSGLPSLTSVYLHEGVIFIKNNAFSNCPNLKSLTIPKSVVGRRIVCVLLSFGVSILLSDTGKISLNYWSLFWGALQHYS